MRKIIYQWAKEKPFIKTVYFYGSRARGEERPDSDLDVAYEYYKKYFNNNYGFPGETGNKDWLQNDLKKQLEKYEGFKFPLDLQIYDSDDTPTVKRKLEKGKILVYTRDCE